MFNSLCLYVTYRVEWTLRLSKLEHLPTTQKADDATSLDDERTGGLYNGSNKDLEETGSSLSDTEDDDLNSSKHDTLFDDSILSDDALLASKARLPSKSPFV